MLIGGLHHHQGFRNTENFGDVVAPGLDKGIKALKPGRGLAA